MAIEKTIKINVDTGNSEAQLNKVSKATENVGDKSKETNNTLNTMTGGAISRFKGLIGSLKSVALGFKSIGFAIAASGIGLLVVGIAAVTAAFKSSEEGQNKFAKIMGVIGSVTGNVVDVISDLGEIIIGVLSGDSKAIKSATAFGKKIFDVVGLPIKNIIDVVKTAANVIQGLWNDGIDGALTALDEGINDIKENFTEAGDAITSAKDALKEFGEEALREAEIAADIADQRAKADKIERGLIVERAVANREIAKLRDKAARADLFSIEERKQALLEASKINEEITQKEITAAKLRRNAIVEENKLSKSTKEDLQAEEEAKARVIELETQKLNLQKRLGTEIASINNQQKSQNEALVKSKQDQVDKEIEAEKKRLKTISDFKKDLDKQNEDLDAKTAEEKLELERERTLLELENLVGNETEKREALLAVNDLFDQKEAELKLEQDEKDLEAAKKKADEEIKIEEEVAAAKASIRDANLNNISKGFSLIASLDEKNKALQATALIAEHGVGIAKSIISTKAANAATTLKYAALPGGIALATAEKTANNISMGLGIAASGLALGKGLAALGKGGGGSSGGGGQETGGGTPAPSFNLVQGTGTNQIAESLQTEQDPIKAVVVSSEVTSAQSLDRNIQENASL